jgi:hypothetical protein
MSSEQAWGFLSQALLDLSQECQAAEMLPDGDSAERRTAARTLSRHAPPALQELARLARQVGQPAEAAAG